MRLISIGFGKVKAVKCYVYLLLWLILVSIGLYWFLNRSASVPALAQSGLGYIESGEIEGSTNGDTGDSTYKHISKHYKKSEDGRGRGFSSLMEHHHLPVFFTKPTHANTYAQRSSRLDNQGTFTEWMKRLGLDESSGVARLCNPPESIKVQDENIHVAGFKLEALVVIFRHGDRGPLTHIGHRNVSHINCSAKSPDLDGLMKFSSDSISKLPGYSQFIGAFHSFPKVPTSPYCSLGQLTQQGSHQLLTLGKLIRSTYKSAFFDPDPLLSGTSVTSNHINSPSLKVLAYSTRYRRTFQSLFAFLYGLLGPKQLLQSATIRESQSITFCFHDCSCRTADKLKKAATKKYKPMPEYKSAMNSLVSQLNTVLGTEKSKKAGSSLLDSLLVYPCHKMELPCHEDNHKDKGVKLIYKAFKKLSAQYRQQSDSSPCVTLEHLEQLVNFIRLDNSGLKESKENYNYHLLSSYGLLKEIVNVALKMTSSGEASRKQHFSYQTAPFAASSSLSSSVGGGGNGFGRKINKKTRIVVFSGHDITLQSLTSALLGVSSDHPDIQLPPFASRLIFEFYRKTNISPNSPRKHYFRVIFNGIAVTHLITFCKGSRSSNANNNLYSDYSNVGKADKFQFSPERDANDVNEDKSFMCPVEYLVRFLHDHYFESLGNVTNFKDACQL